MEWYVYLLTVSGLIFLVQFILSIVGMDSDIDFDSEFSFGDIITFKGIIHFIIGFSLTLTLCGSANTIAYIIAVGVGIIFLGLLSFVYRLVCRLKQELVYQEKIENECAEVYYWNDKLQKGIVFLTLEGRLTEICAKSNSPIILTPGTKVIVSGNRNLVTILQKL